MNDAIWATNLHLMGFEPTRTIRPVHLKCTPLDHSGTNAPHPRSMQHTHTRSQTNVRIQPSIKPKYYHHCHGIYYLLTTFLPFFIILFTTLSSLEKEQMFPKIAVLLPPISIGLDFAPILSFLSILSNNIICL